MLKDILESHSVDELKQLGKYREVRSLLQKELTNRLQIKARGWNDLFDAVYLVKKISSVPVKNHQAVDTSQEISYFKSETDRLIYSLIELSGESQLQALGINKSHFRDAKKAKKLRNKIAHEIHPDKSGHPKSEEAMGNLTKLFKGVIG